MSRKPADRFAKPDAVSGDMRRFQAMANERARTAPTDAEVRRAELKRLEPERIQRLIESGIRGVIMPEDFEYLSKGKAPILTSALDAVQRWEADREAPAEQRVNFRPMTTMVLVGLTGRGKTVAGGWLIARHGGDYVVAEDACKMFKAHADSPAGRQWKQLLQKRVLVLDDLGTELDAEVALAMLTVVVNSRTGLGAGWTLLTANLLKEEFFRRYGERAIRRIEHMGRIIEVGGPNQRRTESEKGYDAYLRSKSQDAGEAQKREGPRERSTRPMQQQRLPEHGGRRRSER